MSMIDSAVDGFLRGCSIEHISTTLRATLGDLLKSEGLRSPVNVGETIRIFLMHSELVGSLLGHPTLSQIATDGEGGKGCDIRLILLNGKAIASRLGHEEVNEIHLLVGLLELYPTEVTVALQLLLAANRKACPKGTPRQQRLLNFARAENRPKWIAQVLAAIEETPFSVARIHDSALRYLSSPYYPYGSQQWLHFERDHPRVGDFSSDTFDKTTALIGFFSHGFGLDWAKAWRRDMKR
jgi:hypothetical protein